MDDFTTIRLKRNVVKKFKEYSKKTSPSYSETLDYMIAFFEDTGMTPFDVKRSPMLSFTASLTKRTKAVAAILRNIEKTQLIPTREMLESLFEQQEEEEDEMEEWIEYFKSQSMENETEQEHIEITVPKIRYERLEDKMDLIKKDFGYVLDKVKLVKSSFGKNYLRLELTEGEIEKFKRTI